MEKEMEPKSFPTLYFCLDDLTNQLEGLDRDNGIYDSLENLEFCFNSFDQDINFDEGDSLDDYSKTFSKTFCLVDSGLISKFSTDNSKQFNNPENVKTSTKSNQNTKSPSFTQNVEIKSNENKELKLSMNPEQPDQMGNENFLLEFEESRRAGGSAVIGQNRVRCRNPFLSLDDQNHHSNCQHRLTFSKSANFESFHQPSNVIEFLIYFGRNGRSVCAKTFNNHS